MTSVILVDDHAIIREGLSTILVRGGIKILAEVGNLPELWDPLRKYRPDVLILDISMPRGNGLEALKDIKKEMPNQKILILSIYPEEQYAVRSIKLGASGYLTKDCAPEQLVTAVKIVDRGDRFLTPKVAELLASELQHSGGRQGHEELSERELEVLISLAKGLSLSEIAKSAGLSVKTMSTYKTRMMKKMNLSNNADIVKYVVSHNL